MHLHPARSELCDHRKIEDNTGDYCKNLIMFSKRSLALTLVLLLQLPSYRYNWLTFYLLVNIDNIRRWVSSFFLVNQNFFWFTE